MLCLVGCFVAIGILLEKCICLTMGPKNTNDKPYQQIQNILTNALGTDMTHNNHSDDVSLFPWKKSTTVLEYHNILDFEDESVLLYPKSKQPLGIFKQPYLPLSH